jgi:hypothetical protein
MRERGREGKGGGRDTATIERRKVGVAAAYQAMIVTCPWHCEVKEGYQSGWQE